MVKPKTARVQRGTQLPTFIHKNASTSELLDQIMSPCIAEQRSSTEAWVVFNCCRKPTANKLRAETNIHITVRNGNAFAFPDFSGNFCPFSTHLVSVISQYGHQNRQKAHLADTGKCSSLISRESTSSPVEYTMKCKAMPPRLWKPQQTIWAANDRLHLPQWLLCVTNPIQTLSILQKKYL